MFLAAAPILLGIATVTALRPEVRLLEQRLPDLPALDRLGEGKPLPAAV